MQEVEQTAGGEKLVDRRRAQNRRNDQDVNDHPQCRHAENRRRECQGERPAEYGKEPVDRVHAAHDEIGVGDPDHVDHAEDQVQTEGEQRQDACEQQAVDRRFEQEHVHARYNPI